MSEVFPLINDDLITGVNGDTTQINAWNNWEGDHRVGIQTQDQMAGLEHVGKRLAVKPKKIPATQKATGIFAFSIEKNIEPGTSTIQRGWRYGNGQAVTGNLENGLRT